MRKKNTPNDPERRERIVTATMQLLEESGIGAVTARTVAARVGVPVGSVSYYFDSVRSLLLEASRRVIHLRAMSLETLREGVTPETVLRRLAELIHHQLTTGRALTVVAYEMYVLGLRDDEFRVVSARSIHVLRERLLEYCSPDRATQLAATADGYQLESLFVEVPPSVGTILKVLGKR